MAKTTGRRSTVSKRPSREPRLTPDLEKVRAAAKDLTTTYPRSPRELLGGYVIVARCVDKARAELAGTNGDYTYYPCSLCKLWFDYTGITPAQLRAYVSTGASDDEVAAWIQRRSKVRGRAAIIRWNNRMRELRLSDLPVETQAMLEEYIPRYLPAHRPVYVYFDVYDLEEKRL